MPALRVLKATLAFSISERISPRFFGLEISRDKTSVLKTRIPAIKSVNTINLFLYTESPLESCPNFFEMLNDMNNLPDTVYFKVRRYLGFYILSVTEESCFCSRRLTAHNIVFIITNH